MTLDDFEVNLKRTIQDGKMSINPGLLKIFPVYDEILLELFGQDILQKLLNYNIDLFNINGDFETTNRYYKGIVEHCLNEKDIDTYTYNLNNIVKRSKKLKKFLLSLEEKSITLLSEIRILMKRKPVYTKIMFKLLPMKKFRHYDREVEKEKKEVKQEIEESIKKSEQEIEKY